MTIKVEFTAAEINELINLLVDTSMQMDDDGRDGAFDASPLHRIYQRLLASRQLSVLARERAQTPSTG